MSQDAGMRARVEGRNATAARTAWSLDVAGFRVRCLKQADGTFVVQGRSDKGWTEKICAGANPLALLRAVVASNGVAIAAREVS